MSLSKEVKLTSQVSQITFIATTATVLDILGTNARTLPIKVSENESRRVPVNVKLSRGRDAVSGHVHCCKQTQREHQNGEETLMDSEHGCWLISWDSHDITTSSAAHSLWVVSGDWADWRERK